MPPSEKIARGMADGVLAPQEGNVPGRRETLSR